MFAPLLGEWVAKEDSPERPKLSCKRSFNLILQGKYIQLNAHWKGDKIDYEDMTLFGVADKEIVFWPFQSDGKRAQGHLAAAGDIHPEAICFEAQMPSGYTRQVYWPDEKEGFHWVVEPKNQERMESLCTPPLFTFVKMHKYDRQEQSMA